MKNLFFLVDLMLHTDNSIVAKYLAHSDCFNITCCQNYYQLYKLDLSKYQHKFACIQMDFMHKDASSDNIYWEDLEKRVSKLKVQNFKFILMHAWESRENTANLKKKYVEILEKQLRGDYHEWYGDHDWFWFVMYDQHKNNDYNFDHSVKIHDFFYLNKMARSHRRLLFQKLYEENLLNNSIISYRQPPYNIILDKVYELPGIEEYPIYGKDSIIFEKPYNVSAINLVSETNDNDTEIFMTEKIWKPILAGQPFLVHGNKNYLKKLKDLGFETYGKWLDESYDDVSERDKKIDKIKDVCAEVVKMDYKKFYDDCKNVRTNNQKQFYNLIKLKEIINQRIEKLIVVDQHKKFN